MAAEFNVHQSSLGKAFRELGAPSRTEREQDLRERIVASYADDELSVRDIAEATGLCVTAVRNHLHAADVPLRLKSGQGALPLPGDVLTDDWVHTEAGACVCGLIVTDGSFRLNRNNGSAGQSPMLRIALAEHDRDGVVAAAHAFGIDESRIKTYRYRDRSQSPRVGAALEFTHPKLWFLHHRLGMPLGDKTTTARLPDVLLGNRHAWRGVFDGDGTAWMKKTTACLPEVSLTLTGASPLLHEQLMQFAAPLGVPLRQYTRKREDRWAPTTDSVASAEPAARLVDEVYRDCTFTIARKRDRAWVVREARFGKPGRAPRRPRVTDDEAAAWLVRFNAGESVSTLEKSTGRSYMTVQSWLRKLGADA